MMICLNERHYATDCPLTPLTADPRLHVADGTPCEAFAAPASRTRPEPRIYEASPITGRPRMVRSRKLYRTIVVDPPWAYRMNLPRTHRGTARGARHLYPVASTDEIAALPIGEWAFPDAHLFIWAPAAFITKEARELVEGWGFDAKTVLTWDKQRLGIGMYFRNVTEFVLFSVRGHLPTARRDQGTLISAPRTRHSEKPQAFYDMVESMSPGPYLDVFARKQRFGWDCFGNEVYNEPELLETLTPAQRQGLVAKESP